MDSTIRRRWLLAVCSSSIIILSSFGILAPVLGWLGTEASTRVPTRRCSSSDSVSWKVRNIESCRSNKCECRTGLLIEKIPGDHQPRNRQHWCLTFWSEDLLLDDKTPPSWLASLGSDLSASCENQSEPGYFPWSSHLLHQVKPLQMFWECTEIFLLNKTHLLPSNSATILSCKSTASSKFLFFKNFSAFLTSLWASFNGVLNSINNQQLTTTPDYSWDTTRTSTLSLSRTLCLWAVFTSPQFTLTFYW